MSAHGYGLVARFADAGALARAAARLRAQGVRRLEAFTPFPVPEVSAALAPERSWLAPAMFAGGALAGLGTFALEAWSAVYDYPLNVGGRPLFSWPAFVPAALEMILLGAALSGVVAVLWRDGLPRFHHPVFEAPGFGGDEAARWLLCVRADEPDFDVERAGALLRSLGAVELRELGA